MPLPDGGGGQGLDGSVETLLAQLASLARTVLMWTRLPLPLPVEESVQHSVMSGAQNGAPILITRKRVAALGERTNMMDVEDAPAVACQVRESALSVVCENA